VENLFLNDDVRQSKDQKGILAKGTFYQVISGVIFVVSGYVIHIGLGRYLGPELYGIFGIVVSLLGINYLFLLTGVRDAVSRYIAQAPTFAYPILKQGLRVQGVLSLTLAFLYFCFARIIANWLNDPSLVHYIRLSAMAIPLTAMYTVYLGFYNGMRYFDKEAMIKSAYSITKVILVFCFVFLGFRISGAIFGYIVASLIVLLLAMYVFKCEKTAHSFDYKTIVKFATPIVIFSVVSTLITSLDLIFVKAILQDNSKTGFYTAASNLTKTPLPIFYAFSLTLFPSISKSTSRTDLPQTQTYIKNFLKYLAMLLIPTAFLVSATSKNLVTLFYSNQFSSAGEPLKILIFGMLFFSIFTLLITVINASGRPIISMVFGLVIIPLNITLNLILIPSYQLVGAALATSFSILFGLFVAGIYVYSKFKALVDFGMLVKILVASLVIFAIAIVFPVSGFFLLVEYAILFVFYFLLLYLLKSVITEDIKRAKVVLKTIAGK
jgi:O-antigen/teichoic acid export membrane protein